MKNSNHWKSNIYFFWLVTVIMDMYLVIRLYSKKMSKTASSCCPILINGGKWKQFTLWQGHYWIPESCFMCALGEKTPRAALGRQLPGSGKTKRGEKYVPYSSIHLLLTVQYITHTLRHVLLPPRLVFLLPNNRRPPLRVVFFSTPRADGQYNTTFWQPLIYPQGGYTLLVHRFPAMLELYAIILLYVCSWCWKKHHERRLCSIGEGEGEHLAERKYDYFCSKCKKSIGILRLWFNTLSVLRLFWSLRK